MSMLQHVMGSMTAVSRAQLTSSLDCPGWHQGHGSLLSKAHNISADYFLAGFCCQIFAGLFPADLSRMFSCRQLLKQMIINPFHLFLLHFQAIPAAASVAAATHPHA